MAFDPGIAARAERLREAADELDASIRLHRDAADEREAEGDHAMASIYREGAQHDEERVAWLRELAQALKAEANA